MASENRVSQINGELQRVLSSLLRQVKDPRVQGLTSVSRVDVSRDLSKCRVFVSVLEEDKREGVIRGLTSASGFLRREAGRALGLRHMPQLQFILDDGIREGARILRLLNDTRTAEQENAAADAGQPSEEDISSGEAEGGRHDD